MKASEFNLKRRISECSVQSQYSVESNISTIIYYTCGLQFFEAVRFFSTSLNHKHESMSSLSPNKLFELVDTNQIEAVECPCGQTRRAFTEDPDQTASLHVVDICTDAKTHYHRKLTEIYYILEGSGQMELDGELYPVGPGSAVLIKPGCRHRAIGEMRIINIPVPAFDPNDEWFD